MAARFFIVGDENYNMEREKTEWLKLELEILVWTHCFKYTRKTGELKTFEEKWMCNTTLDPFAIKFIIGSIGEMSRIWGLARKQYINTNFLSLMINIGYIE